MNTAAHGAIRTSARRWAPAALTLVLSVLALGSTGVAPALADDPGATSAGASASSVKSVRKGDRGPAVRRIQRRLHVSADGVFGRDTARAVRRFQRRRGLEDDGIVGPVTRRAMRLRPFPKGSVVHVAPDVPSGGGGGRGVRLPRALIRIAVCESGGNPRAISPDGQYRGKYQFTRGTWKDYGGRGDDPAEASERHQDRIALRLFRARGGAPWPVCSK